MVQTCFSPDDHEYSIIDLGLKKIIQKVNRKQIEPLQDNKKSFWLVGPHQMVFLDTHNCLNLYDFAEAKVIAEVPGLFENSNYRNATFHSWRQRLFLYTFIRHIPENRSCEDELHLGVFDPVSKKLEKFLFMPGYFMCGIKELQISQQFQDSSLACLVSANAHITDISLQFLDTANPNPNRHIHLDMHDRPAVDFVDLGDNGEEQAIAVHCEHNKGCMFAIIRESAKSQLISSDPGWEEEKDDIVIFSNGLSKMESSNYDSS